MITIWKLENEAWILIGNFTGSIEELSFELGALRASGDEYRAELETESNTKILEV
jgi:hypothetical protein